MLNNIVTKVKSNELDIQGWDLRVGDTGISAAHSANLGPKRLAKQRLQRMRRRHERAQWSRNVAMGWITRMAF